MKKIVLFGCGGHSKVIVDIIQAASEYSIAAFFDNNPRQADFFGLPVISDIQKLKNYTNENNIAHAVIAVGNNSARKKLQQEATGLGLKMATLIHPSALIARTATLGAGTVAMPGVIVNADTTIEDGCILNSGAIVEHDCSIGAFTHIAPGTVLCGGVSVGAETLIGARSVVIPMIQVGSHVTLGAGSVVIRNIPDAVCAIGNPARIKNK